MHRSLIALLTGLLVAAPLLVTTPAQARSITKATVASWYDGDTVRTNRGDVRLIGIDTPERGQCGARKATRLSRRLAPIGSRVTLIRPKGVPNRDKYGRLLRYVKGTVKGKKDIGATQIKRGAWARYDSRDGYARHPRQAKYRKLDATHRNHCGRTHPDNRAKPKKQNPRHNVGGGVAPASRNTCPASAPIKGNKPSFIYHMPGQRYYSVTNPEVCFRTESAAQAAGFRRAKV